MKRYPVQYKMRDGYHDFEQTTGGREGSGVSHQTCRLQLRAVNGEVQLEVSIFTVKGETKRLYQKFAGMTLTKEHAETLVRELQKLLN